MKVIIVAEVHDDCNVEDLKADVRFYSKDKLFFRRRRKVKKMPEKKDTYEPSDNHEYSKAEIMAYTYGLTVGRNLCIEEIENG